MLHETQKCFFFSFHNIFLICVLVLFVLKKEERNSFQTFFLPSFLFLSHVPIPYFNPSLFFFLPLVPIPSFTLLSFSFSLFSPSLFFLLPLFLVDQIYFCFLSRTRRLRIYKQREFKFF